MAKFPGSTKKVSANRATLPRLTKKAGPAGTRSLAGARDMAAAAHRQAPYNPKAFPDRV